MRLWGDKGIIFSNGAEHVVREKRAKVVDGQAGM